MKRFQFRAVFISFALLVPNFAFSQTYHLVSDIDDTLKISNVRSFGALLYNGLYGHEVFLGMSEFYQSWVNSNLNTVSYLSRSPDFLSSNLKTLLFKENAFPEGKIRLRHLSELMASEDYKVSRLKKLLSQEHQPLVLIGDDGERDPEVFDQIMNEPSVVQNKDVIAAYIHQIVGRPLPQGVIPFVTAFDLALREVEAGRLPSRKALFIGETILDADQGELLFPKFKKCPTDFSYQMSDTSASGLGPVVEQDSQLVSLASRVKEYIQSYCKLNDPQITGEFDSVIDKVEPPVEYKRSS